MRVYRIDANGDQVSGSFNESMFSTSGVNVGGNGARAWLTDDSKLIVAFTDASNLHYAIWDDVSEVAADGIGLGSPFVHGSISTQLDFNGKVDLQSDDLGQFRFVLADQGREQNVYFDQLVANSGETAQALMFEGIQTVIDFDGSSGAFDEALRVNGVWEIASYAIGDLPVDDGEFIITLESPYDNDPNIEGDSGNNRLAPMGNASSYDFGINTFTKPLTINGYEGIDRISGGAGSVDHLDGGEESDSRSNGRDYDQDGNLVIDRIYYIDADHGIVANFETGVVGDDGFGSIDYVSNFERVYGSYMTTA